MPFIRWKGHNNVRYNRGFREKNIIKEDKKLVRTDGLFRAFATQLISETTKKNN